MERESLWKNFLTLVVGGLLALHVSVSQAADDTKDTTTSPDASADCTLEL